MPAIIRFRRGFYKNERCFAASRQQNNCHAQT
jgi:hypothetical protein